jgi:hypothetical protein
MILAIILILLGWLIVIIDVFYFNCTKVEKIPINIPIYKNVKIKEDLPPILIFGKILIIIGNALFTFEEDQALKSGLSAPFSEKQYIAIDTAKGVVLLFVKLALKRAAQLRVQLFILY